MSSVSRYLARHLPTAAILLSMSLGASTKANAATELDKATQNALSKLEAMLPLSAADHTALKRAAQALKVEVLKVCGDPGNMPLSNIKREGYQNKVVEIVANSMGAYVDYFWRPYLARGMTRQTLDTYDCDILLDIPPGVEYALTTQPVYKTTFVFATRSDRNLNFDGLDDPRLKQLKIGVYQTSALRTALTAHSVQQNVRIHALSHDGDLVEKNQPWYQVQQVVDGDLDVAGVWGPFAGWLKSKGAPIELQPVNLMDDEVPLEFELSLGLKKTDYIMMYKLDLALEEKKAEIEAALRSFGVPLVQCSRCTVAGDLPAHGVYNKVLTQATPPDESKKALDQRVTRERLESWLAEGADIQQELSNAVLAADIERIKFLASKGADINKLDKQGYAAIHSAARSRKTDLARALLELGAKIDAPDSDGMTPLQHAVLRDDPDTIRLLAEGGAKLEPIGAGGLTALGMAIVEDRYKAAMALIGLGAPVDTASGEQGLTPLMLAAGKEGHRLSLGAGKDRIEKLNPHDPGTLEIVRALLAKGAKVNALSASGVSALILAAAHNNAPIVGVLVQAGADVKQTSRDGKTASQIAEANGNNNVVSLLRLLEQSGSN